MTKINEIEKAIDDAFVWGQVDILLYVLNTGQNDPPGKAFLQLLKGDAFEKKRDELFWKYTCWCLAHNIMVASMPQWFAGRHASEV